MEPRKNRRSLSDDHSHRCLLPHIAVLFIDNASSRAEDRGDSRSRLLSLNENLLNHLRIGQLDVICPTVQQLVYHVSVNLFVFLPQKFHRGIHERQKLLLLHVSSIRANKRCFKILNAFSFKLFYELIIRLFLSPF